MGIDVSSLHFRWEELPTDRPMKQVARQRVVGEEAMVSRVTLEKGCRVPVHSHDNEQIACVLEGCLQFMLGAKEDSQRSEVYVRAGEVLHLPANLPHEAHAIEKTVVLDVFSPPSETTGLDGAGK